MPRGSRRRPTAPWTALSLLWVLAAGCRGGPAPRMEPGPSSHGGPTQTGAVDPSTPAAIADTAASVASLPPLHPTSEAEALPPTPMLDAAFQRAEAMKRDLAPGPDRASPPDPPAEKPLPTLAEPTRTASPAIPVAIARPLDADLSPEDAWDASLMRLRHLAHERSSGVGGDDDWVLREKVLGGLSERGGDVRKAVRAAVGAEDAMAEPATPLVEDDGPFRVNELKACRRVMGFGNVQPWEGSAIRPGQSLILYCDLGGVRHEPEGDRFRSRLESTIVLVPESGGEPAWTQPLGTGEDLCARHRRDFFVSYQITLPRTLPAGTFQLRLLLKDLVAGRETSESIPLTVGP